MSIHSPLHTSSAHPELAEVPGAMLTSTASKALAVLRISTGFIFLWAFLDKMFGWHYSTVGSSAWIHGGSPTKGFLSSVSAGPFQSSRSSTRSPALGTRTGCSCSRCSVSELP